MTAPEFRPIPGFPNYEISRTGIVKNKSGLRIRPLPARQGNPKVYNLRVNNVCHCRTGRRLVLAAFGKTWRPKYRPWCGWGEQIGNHRLTEAEVYEIRDLLASGETQKNIARLFKTTQSHVWRIKHRLAWKNLKDKQ